MYFWLGKHLIDISLLSLIFINYFFCFYSFSSKIQGLGLYAARDLEKHTMVIEYIGEVIRSELSELREKQYEAKVNDFFFFFKNEIIELTKKYNFFLFIISRIEVFTCFD